MTYMVVTFRFGDTQVHAYRYMLPVCNQLDLCHASIRSMKRQQQTLSVRISDAMRQRLEGARQLLAKAADEPASISDVANRFLENARDEIIEAGGNHLELDHYYLSHLRLSGMPDYPDQQVNLAAVIEAAQYWIGKIREARANGRGQFAPRYIGRNLYVFFRDERLKGIELLNEVLRPYLAVFLRIAARGHYLREHRPARDSGAELDYSRPRPPLP